MLGPRIDSRTIGLTAGQQAIALTATQGDGATGHVEAWGTFDRAWQNGRAQIFAHCGAAYTEIADGLILGIGSQFLCARDGYYAEQFDLVITAPIVTQRAPLQGEVCLITDRPAGVRLPHRVRACYAHQVTALQSRINPPATAKRPLHGIWLFGEISLGVITIATTAAELATGFHLEGRESLWIETLTPEDIWASAPITSHINVLHF